MLITIDSSIAGLRGVFEPYAKTQYLEAGEISSESLGKSEALIVRTTRKYGAETLAGSSVKFLGTASAGFDHIDTEFCENNGIFWTAAPGCNADSVAEYVEAGLREIANLHNHCQLSIGIVGVGEVGSRIKKIAENLGMRVLLCDPPKNLNDNIFEADVVTLHVPLTKGGDYPTYHLANEEFFSKMKNDAWFINTARGAVCDSEALRKALSNNINGTEHSPANPSNGASATLWKGSAECEMPFSKKSGTQCCENTIRLGGAIIDTWENEPNIDDSLLPFMEIATPHIAGHAKEAKDNANQMIANSLGKFFGIEELAKWHVSSHNNQKNINPDMHKFYDIRHDDALFRKNPKNFNEFRNGYERKYLSKH